MLSSILGVLSKGRTRVHERLNSNARTCAIQEWVNQHEQEITNARIRGYTWREITRACAETWKHNGIFKGVYIWKSETLISKYYNRLKRHERQERLIRLSED